MRISPIINTGYNKYNNQSRNVQQRPAFTAHPDLAKLAEKYNVTASSYFRRGQFYGPPSKSYMDVVDIFNSMFKTGEDKQRRMLIIGVGNSQEPFSYLATIKSALKDRPLKKNLDLYTVDLQSKPVKEDLFKASFYESQSLPEYSGNSFIIDRKNQGIYYNCHYRVKDEIFDFVNEAYNNPRKTKWDSRVQDVIQYYPKNSFDVVSANNVIPYITSPKEITKTLKHIKRILKPDGYFITDPTKFNYMTDDILEGLKEVKTGIYQKVKQ